MAIDINWILPILIVGGLIIILACRATGQTVGELFRDIRDFFMEKKEDVTESTLGNYGR